MDRESAISLERLLPRLRASFGDARAADPAGWATFERRLETHFGDLFRPLLQLYGNRYDFFWQLEQLLELSVRSWLDRPDPLRSLDDDREARGDWFADHRMVGGVCYVDLFAGDLAGIRDRIPYFAELGLTYLHLMPLFRCPEGNSDGGYAVSSYREVNPALGTIADLASLANELRQHGISLVLDFIFNHTSDEHDWAIEARAHPDDEERNAYIMFPDRTMPDAFDATCREIFPDQRPGSFSWVADIDGGGRWVWTTFHTFQWDLNYANPMVFRRMAGEMLFLANQGVDILRLDAVAFCWKRLGTPCESLPEAHLIVRAFNAIARIAAPSLLFKSEAIVHPAEVASYIDPAECQLSYNPLLMALMWETLATRESRLLRRSMQHWFAIPAGTAWVNYVRSHDDIGWTFDDADADQLAINGYDHRRFLNRFYTGRFTGTFARGLPFQENPKTGDARISGTAASLAGLEKALAEEGPREVELALRRVLLMYGIAMTVGGIPLIYLGDELATLNDYGFASDHAKAEDSRWVHRPAADLEALARRHDPETLEGRMFAGMQRLIALRKNLPVLAGGVAEFPETGNERVFAVLRPASDRGVLMLANISDHPTEIFAGWLRSFISESVCHDLVNGARHELSGALPLEPYQLVVVPISG